MAWADSQYRVRLWLSLRPAAGPALTVGRRTSTSVDRRVADLKANWSRTGAHTWTAPNRSRHGSGARWNRGWSSRAASAVTRPDAADRAQACPMGDPPLTASLSSTRSPAGLCRSTWKAPSGPKLSQASVGARRSATASCPESPARRRRASLRPTSTAGANARDRASAMSARSVTIPSIRSSRRSANCHPPITSRARRHRSGGTNHERKGASHRLCTSYKGIASSVRRRLCGMRSGRVTRDAFGRRRTDGLGATANPRSMTRCDAVSVSVSKRATYSPREPT